jgi:hypothetical protein
MSIASRKNIGAFIKSVIGGVVTNVTAAGSGDNTLVNGTSVDLSANGQPLSCSVVFPVKSVLASAKTVSLSAALQTTADSTNGPWTNVSTLASTVVATGGSGGSTQSGTLDFDVDLSGAKQYVRVAYTPLMSATGTDTANVYPPVLILAGQSELPV